MSQVGAISPQPILPILMRHNLRGHCLCLPPRHTTIRGASDEHQSHRSLIIIGGHADKEGERTILKAVAQCACGENGRPVIVTVASNQPEELGREYRALFKDLGVGDVQSEDISVIGSMIRKVVP